jgi:hypothetical protein
MFSRIRIAPLTLMALLAGQSSAFSARPAALVAPQRATISLTADRKYDYFGGATTIDAPTKEDIETDRKTRRRTGGGDDGKTDLGTPDENFLEALRKEGPLEYLEDQDESREPEDPFHILLLSSTFEKPKITVPYAAGALEFVLDMPLEEGIELSQFSYEHGMSCLGTWPREQCLTLGKQLQVRDLVCRVVPFCEGGQRGWQAKDADFSNMQDAPFLS